MEFVGLIECDLQLHSEVQALLTVAPSQKEEVVYELAGLPIKGNSQEHNIKHLEISRFVSMHKVKTPGLN